MKLSRRELLAGIGAGLLAAACDRNGEPGLLRVGVMSNLTHAPMIAGLGSGRVARALGGVRVEWRVFRAGPRVIEALIGGAIDVGVCGPSAVIATQARHGEGTLRVLSGVCSGGASLVVAKGAAVREASDLRGKAVAVTQIGSTQDVSLKKYLRASGLETTARGGDVTLHALAAADIRTQMMRGEIAAAWLPEPWPTRLVDEGAVRLIDERDLWPGKRFSSAMLVARSPLAAARHAELGRLVDALASEVDRSAAPGSESRGEAHAEIQRLTRNAGPRPIFDAAWKYVDFTSDPLESAVEVLAGDTAALGIVPSFRCASLFTGVAS